MKRHEFNGWREIEDGEDWMLESPTGNWVRFEDHEEEIAARDQALKDLGYQLGEAEQELAKARDENERLRKQLSARLQELERIQQERLTWAMVCICGCSCCCALDAAIRGEVPQTGSTE